MNLFDRNLSVLNSFKEELGNYEFLLFTRRRAKDFSRYRKMGFSDIISCMLNFFKKDAQVEVDEFLQNVKRKDIAMSEQAFLKARQKVLPRAFTRLNDVMVNDVYAKPEYYYTYKGFRLLAVDGTVLTLNNTKVMQEAFGGIETQSGNNPAAQASCLYDVENGIVLHSIIDSYKSDERKMALKHIEKLDSFGYKNDLILFDRGYPSTELISKLIGQNIKFVMRVSSKFLRQINEFNDIDGIVKIKSKEKEIDIRVINVELKTGEIEKLITNVFDETFTPSDFKELYFKRWGIETRYDFLKNKLEIENFTGDSKLTVEQDFYASVYLSNLCELMKACSDELIQEENSNKNLKRDYKTNQKRLIAKLKNNLIKIVAEDDEIKKEIMLNQLIDEIHKKPVAIRPDRSFPRIKKGATIKFPKNKKRSL